MSEPYPLILVLAFPLFGFLINGLWGRRLPKGIVGLVGAGSILLSFVCAIFAVVWLLKLHPDARTFDWLCPLPWIEGGGFTVEFGLLLDPLSAVMILVVSGVSFLIHWYSIGYMGQDPEYSRYFALLNLFVFFMLLLVLADNLLLMFVGWEGVGLCSFQLISFWYERHTAADAGKKAFIVSRVGDFGFVLAALALFAYLGTINFEQLRDAIQHEKPVTSWMTSIPTPATELLATKTPLFDASLAVVICLALLWGATGKSAQFLLHVWLPDAMEGPTPVSALIHAATMVTAGVYLVARMHFLFAIAPTALLCVAFVGAFTAFLAATMGMVMHDVKRVLAYSTISQIGYMFLGCGVGAYAAAIFHFMTHAFFKALLFLGAGSVMHAVGEHYALDMRKTGGLKVKLQTTHRTFLVATLAIIGVPLFSGFFSKDEILHGAFAKHSAWWLAGTLTAVLTTFYMLRLLYRIFEGKPKDKELFEHAHESPQVMLNPLRILALLSFAGGFVWMPSSFFGGVHLFPRFLEPVFGAHEVAKVNHVEHVITGIIILSSLAALGVGWAVAHYLYLSHPGRSEVWAKKLGGLYRAMVNKWYFDEIYFALIVRPGRRVSEWVRDRFDLGVIDLIVNGVGWLTVQFGLLTRRLQTGYVRNYALSIIVAGLIALGYLVLRAF